MLSSQPQNPVENRSPKELRAHRQAALVPSMTVVEAQALEADIAERGIQVPLEITAAGVVLDGRHRHRVALALGLETVPVRVIDPPDQLEYMLLAAFQRRHLDTGQRAVLVLELEGYRQRRAEAALRKSANLRNSAVDVAALPHRAGRSRDHAAAVAGVSPRSIQNAILVKEHSPALYTQLRAGEVSLDRAVLETRRQTRYAAIGEAPPLPDGEFDLIYADPPWQLGHANSESAPEQHYPTIPLDELAALPIPAAEHALLYLWAVNSHLPDALELMKAWRFDYRGNEVWVKQSIGRGVWTRNQHELLLIGRRGTASPAPPRQLLGSVIAADRRRHSAKPTVVYERLEQLYPRHSKLELFARGKPREGWHAWGNEVTP